RDAESVREQWTFEPNLRLRRYLARIGVWDKEREDALQRDCAAEVNAAVDAYFALPPPTCDAMFDHLYQTLPDALEAQREESRKFSSPASSIRRSTRSSTTPDAFAIAPAGASRARLCCARPPAPASTLPNIIRRVPKRCSPTFRGCAW